MNTVIGWLVKFSAGAKIAQAVAWVHDKLDGHRSEISAGLLVIVHVLKKVGIIPPEAAGAVENALAAILPVLIADRVSKVLKTADQFVADAPAQDQPKQ